MKTKFNVILTLLLAFMVQISFAQMRTISGVVSDEIGPISDVTVKVTGSTQGAVTDFDGNYSVKAKTGDILSFSHVSYGADDKTVGSSDTINVTMSSTGTTLDEVVVVGAYDITRTKAQSLIAATTIDTRTIENRPNASLVQTLQGQVAGLNITTSNGQPGAGSEVILRGVGSVNGNTDPLYILDGVVIDGTNFRSINQNEIETFSVLKDAGATSIYGNRGANGVIIITTKQGKFNAPLKIKYSYTTSLSTLQGNDYDLMNSREELQLEQLVGSGLGSTLTDAEILTLASQKNTNWEDVFFRTGINHNHNLQLTAGGENTSTFTSFGYFEQEGILRESDLKRFNFRSNVNGKSKNDRFKYNTSISLNYSKSNEPNSIGTGAINRNYILGAYQSVPYLDESDYTEGEGGNIPVLFVNTPLFLLDRLDTYTRYEEEIRLLGSVGASYKINDNFSVSTKLTTDFTEEQLVRAEHPLSFNAILFSPPAGFQDQNSTRTVNFSYLNSLLFNKVINEKHSINAGLYTDYFKAHYKQFGFRANGLTPNVYSPGDGSAFINDNANDDFNVPTINANTQNSGLFSYFANADYDYSSKYGVGVTIRRDASYRFRKTNRWGTFYSVSGRWNIDKEKFMSSSKFNMLKLRGSYGTSGNQNINGVTGRFKEFAGANLGIDTFTSTGNGYGGLPSTISTQIANPNLKWEVVTQLNIGIDFEYNRRLRGVIDVYNKTTTDIFEQNPIPSYAGLFSQTVNGNGELVNKGVELSLSYEFFKNNNDLSFILRGNGAYNKSERYLNGDEQVGIEEGGAFGQYFITRYAGVNPLNGNLLYLDIDGNLTESPDANDDRVFSGKTRFPDYQGSFGFDLDYKGFYLTSQFNYVIGVDVFDFNYSGFVDPSNIGQFRHSRDLLRAWTPDNRITDIPSLTATNLNLTGDRWLRSGDYVRLRNVSFGYNLSSEYLESLHLSTFKIFFTGENLLTFTNWRGNDVEGTAGGSQQNTYPTPKVISFGVEIGF